MLSMRTSADRTVRQCFTACMCAHPVLCCGHAGEEEEAADPKLRAFMTLMQPRSKASHASPPPCMQHSGQAAQAAVLWQGWVALVIATASRDDVPLPVAGRWQCPPQAVFVVLQCAGQGEGGGQLAACMCTELGCFTLRHARPHSAMHTHMHWVG